MHVCGYSLLDDIVDNDDDDDDDDDDGDKVNGDDDNRVDNDDDDDNDIDNGYDTTSLPWYPPELNDLH